MQVALLVALLMAACAGEKASMAVGLAGQRPTQRVVYVALGASDTVGVGAAHPASENWTARLARHLPRGGQYINLGHSGMTLDRALSAELPAAIAAHPTVVTVWLAVNDLNAQVAPEDYGTEIDRLLAGLERTHALVFVGNVPDLRIVPLYDQYDQADLNATVHAYNRVIAAAVRRRHAVLVDLYAGSRRLWGHPEYISGDRFHPSTRGYAVLAALFYTVMHAHHAL